MTGQIPKYGRFFKLVQLDYSPILANRKYVYRGDERYYTRSDKTSKVWHIYGKFGEFGVPQRSLTKAMEYILAHLSKGA